MSRRASSYLRFDRSVATIERRGWETADSPHDVVATFHNLQRRCWTNAGPTVGIAVSGGGFRAALVGAGTFNALDGRNSSSVQAGTGGVLQLASYMTGLSGGSWFVGSFAINDQPTIYDLVLGSPEHQG